MAYPAPTGPLSEGGLTGPWASALRVPRSFRCPLSGGLMRDPVVSPVPAAGLPAGTSFERAALMGWHAGATAGTQSAPLPVPPFQLLPNASLRAAISEWLEAHGLDAAAAEQLLVLEAEAQQWRREERQAAAAARTAAAAVVVGPWSGAVWPQPQVHLPMAPMPRAPVAVPVPASTAASGAVATRGGLVRAGRMVPSHSAPSLTLLEMQAAAAEAKADTQRQQQQEQYQHQHQERSYHGTLRAPQLPQGHRAAEPAAAGAGVPWAGPGASVRSSTIAAASHAFQPPAHTYQQEQQQQQQQSYDLPPGIQPRLSMARHGISVAPSGAAAERARGASGSNASSSAHAPIGGPGQLPAAHTASHLPAAPETEVLLAGRSAAGGAAVTRASHQRTARPAAQAAAPGARGAGGARTGADTSRAAPAAPVAAGPGTRCADWDWDFDEETRAEWAQLLAASAATAGDPQGGLSDTSEYAGGISPGRHRATQVPPAGKASSGRQHQHQQDRPTVAPTAHSGGRVDEGLHFLSELPSEPEAAAGQGMSAGGPGGQASRGAGNPTAPASSTGAEGRVGGGGNESGSEGNGGVSGWSGPLRSWLGRLPSALGVGRRQGALGTDTAAAATAGPGSKPWEGAGVRSAADSAGPRGRRGTMDSVVRAGSQADHPRHRGTATAATTRLQEETDNSEVEGEDEEEGLWAGSARVRHTALDRGGGGGSGGGLRHVMSAVLELAGLGLGVRGRGSEEGEQGGSSEPYTEAGLGGGLHSSASLGRLQVPLGSGQERSGAPARHGKAESRQYQQRQHGEQHLQRMYGSAGGSSEDSEEEDKVETVGQSRPAHAAAAAGGAAVATPLPDSGELPPPPPLELPLELPLPLQWVSAGQLAGSGLSPRNPRQAAEAQVARLRSWLEGAPAPAVSDLYTLLRCRPAQAELGLGAGGAAAAAGAGAGRGAAGAAVGWSQPGRPAGRQRRQRHGRRSCEAELLAPAQIGPLCCTSVPCGPSAAGSNNSHSTAAALLLAMPAPPPPRVTAMAVLPPPPPPPSWSGLLGLIGGSGGAGGSAAGALGSGLLGGAASPLPRATGRGGAGGAGGSVGASVHPHIHSRSSAFAVLITRDRPSAALLQELPADLPTPAPELPHAPAPQPGPTGRCWALPAVRGRVTAVAACPRGGSVAVGSSAGLVALWRGFEPEALAALREMQDMSADLDTAGLQVGGSLTRQTGQAASRAATAARQQQPRASGGPAVVAVQLSAPSPQLTGSGAGADQGEGAGEGLPPPLEWHLCGRLGWPEEVLSVSTLALNGTSTSTQASTQANITGIMGSKLSTGSMGAAMMRRIGSTGQLVGLGAGSGSGTGSGGQAPYAPSQSQQRLALLGAGPGTGSGANSAGGGERAVTALAYGGGGSVLFAAAGGVVAGWRLGQLDQPERHSSGSSMVMPFMLLTPHEHELGFTYTALPPDSAGDTAGGRRQLEGGEAGEAGEGDSRTGGQRRRGAVTPRAGGANSGLEAGSAGGGALSPRAGARRSLSGGMWLPAGGSVTCLAASPCGAHLAAGLADGSVHLALHAAAAERVVVLRLLPPPPQPALAAAGFPAPGLATQLAFSPDERRLLVLALGLRPGALGGQQQQEGAAPGAAAGGSAAPVAMSSPNAARLGAGAQASGPPARRSVNGGHSGNLVQQRLAAALQRIDSAERSSRGGLDASAGAADPGVAGILAGGAPSAAPTYSAARYTLHCFPLTAAEGLGGSDVQAGGWGLEEQDQQEEDDDEEEDYDQKDREHGGRRKDLAQQQQVTDTDEDEDECEAEEEGEGEDDGGSGRLPPRAAPCSDLTLDWLEPPHYCPGGSLAGLQLHGGGGGATTLRPGALAATPLTGLTVSPDGTCCLLLDCSPTPPQPTPAAGMVRPQATPASPAAAATTRYQSQSLPPAPAAPRPACPRLLYLDLVARTATHVPLQLPPPPQQQQPALLLLPGVGSAGNSPLSSPRCSVCGTHPAGAAAPLGTAVPSSATATGTAAVVAAHPLVRLYPAAGGGGGGSGAGLAGVGVAASGGGGGAGVGCLAVLPGGRELLLAGEGQGLLRWRFGQQ